MKCARCNESLEGRDVYQISGSSTIYCMSCAPLAAGPVTVLEEEKPSATVTSITEKKERSVKEILQHMLDRHEEFTGVVVVANCKNGEQYLRSSKIDCRDKSYLLAFFQAWVVGIFRIHYDEGETDLNG